MNRIQYRSICCWIRVVRCQCYIVTEGGVGVILKWLENFGTEWHEKFDGDYVGQIYTINI